MKSSFTSHSEKETKDFARDFAKQILFNPAQKKAALIIGLEGELGAGKTSFAQGFAKGLGVTEKVLSPTFVILKNYAIPRSSVNGQKSSFSFFYHVDCYRIEKPRELLKLGWTKIIKDSRNVVLVEWADRIKKILPRTALHMSFEHARPGQRKITLDLIC